MTRPPDAQPGPLPGTYWVEPGRLLAGPYPAGWLGALTRRRLKELHAAGVTYFLDLTQPGELDSYAEELPDGAEHHRRPIRDMDVPTPSFMRATLDQLETALAEGHTVYVHCWGGIGRTGTVVGCWLVRRGLTGQQALDRIVALRGGLTNSPQTPAQFAMVRAWSEPKPD